MSVFGRILIVSMLFILAQHSMTEEREDMIFSVVGFPSVLLMHFSLLKLWSPVKYKNVRLDIYS